MMEDRAKIVIDCGSGVCKAGYSGEEAPKVVFNAVVGRREYGRVGISSLYEPDFYVGRDAQDSSIRGFKDSRQQALKTGVNAKGEMLKLKHPIKHGLVVDWDDMEKVSLTKDVLVRTY